LLIAIQKVILSVKNTFGEGLMKIQIFYYESTFRTGLMKIQIFYYLSTYRIRSMQVMSDLK